MKPETRFRIGRVVPFLRTLSYCKIFSIQQKAIVGHPDIILCLDGLFVALEVKTDDKDSTASPRQILTLEEVLKAKGAALIVRPSNFEQVKEDLLKLSRGIRYDRNEICGIDAPKTTTSARKNRQHSTITKAKLRAKQNDVSGENRDYENSGREFSDPKKFRSV